MKLRFLLILAGLLLAGAGVGVYAAKRSAATDPSGAAPPGVRVAERGDGSFIRAEGAAPRVGKGRLLRYAVEVEDGIDQDPAEFATWVDRVLADRRGWTAGGKWSFARDSRANPDFVVRLASPATVDRICGEYGLDTEGEASCRGGENVIINLRRWLLAIPAYHGDVESYRHLVVNHEVGHFLGFDHAACPGEGEPAPVMQTQMYGLDGCVPNAWPYPGG
jgi:hypothetical protein